MIRYLIHFSYIGTRFRGLQKQNRKGVPLYQNETIQSVLETAFLLRLNTANIPKLCASSRTDQGVHAICTAAHIDLEFKSWKSIPPNNHIISCVNSYFSNNDLDVRILSLRKVSDEFNARYSAIRKKYLYRFAVLKADALPDLPNKRHLIPYPILEKDRCLFINGSNLDLEKLKEASQLFLGWNDFTTFMHRAAFNPQVDTRRFIESIELSPGRPLLDCVESQNYNFWEITFCGKSFLYKQIRRMVGVLLAVAAGKLNSTDVEYMLHNPDPSSWNEKATVVPGYALYLLNVEYNESDFLLKQ